jgi:MSHA pilin protein MshD
MPAVNKHRGFTLVELIITMSVISIAVLGITYALSLAFRHQSDGLWQAKSVALAASYLEEIVGRRYDETTPQGGVPPCSPATAACSSVMGPEGETRAEFDDVDDYNGVDDFPPLTAQGTPRTEYASFRVQVSVDYVTPAQVAQLALDTTADAKLITVTVLPPDGSPMHFPLLRGNY